MSANEPSSADDQTILTPTTEQAAGNTKKPSKLPFMALLVVIILVVLGMVGWTLWQQWQRQQSTVLRGIEQTPSHAVSSSQTSQQQTLESSQPATAPKTAKQPELAATTNTDATPPNTSATVTEPVLNQPVASTKPSSSQSLSAPLAVVVDSKELTTAQAEISKLQAALATMQQRNDDNAKTIAALRRSERAAKQALLLNQLDWIIDRNTRLPRMAAIWQSIADNPSYSAAQQQQAADLAHLATQQASTMQQWLRALQELLPSLQAVEHPTLLPNHHWWQRWLNSQFSIHPAASKRDQERALLATRVTATIEQLQRGEVPEDAQWSAMMSKLSSLGFGQATLPATLTSFIAQTARLRAVARQWREVQS